MKNGAGNVTLATILSLASFAGAIVYPTMYVGGLKETNSVQDNRLAHIEATVKDYSDNFDSINTKLNTAAIESAKTAQLLHDLSEDRFQYNPRPSEARAESKALQLIASSTP